MKVAGEIASLLFLQRQQLLVEAPVIGVGCREAGRHAIEAVAQPRQFRRQPAAEAGPKAAVADLFEGVAQPVDRTQHAPDEDVDQQDRQAVEDGRGKETVGELAPDFESFVVGIGRDHDRPVVAGADLYRDPLELRRHPDEADKPARHPAKHRVLDGRRDQRRLVAAQLDAEMAIAVERGDQRVQVARRIIPLPQPFERAVDRLPAHHEGGMHLGAHPPAGGGIGDEASQQETDGEDTATKADQAQPQGHRAPVDKP